MPVRVDVGSFTKQAGTGNQDITIPVDLTGAASGTWAIIFWTAGSDAASGTWDPHIDAVIGFVANGGGSISQYSAHAGMEDAVGTSNTARRMAAAAITVSTGAGSAAAYEATFTSFPTSTSMRLNWSVNATDAIEINYMIISGLTGAKVVNWTTPTSAIDKEVTGVGFSPDLVLHAAAPVTALGSAANAYFVFGAMNSNGEQWSNSVDSEDAQTATVSSRFQQTDACFAWVGDNENIYGEASYVSMNSGGFTVNFSQFSGSAYNVISLCLDGVRSKVGSFSKSTEVAPASQEVASNHGFTPRGLLLTSMCRVSSGSPGSSALWGMGATDFTNERSVALADIDAADPTQADSIWYSDKVFAKVDSGPTTEAVADYSSSDTDSFTLSWTTNDGEATQILYLIFGESNVAPNTPTALTQTSEHTDTTPTFSASISDPDTGQQIKGRFKLYQNDETTLIGTIDSSLRTGAGSVSAEYTSALSVGTYKVKASTVDDQGLESADSAFITFYIKVAVQEDDLDLIWNVIESHQKDLQLIWNVAANNQTNLELLWNVFALLDPPKDLELLWTTETPWGIVDDAQGEVWTLVEG